MNNNIRKLLSAGALMIFFGMSTGVAAQEANVIEQVNLKNDGFNDFRKHISENFDFSNPNMEEGISQSVIKFQVSEKGKMQNIHAESKCKFVKAEIENFLKNTKYRFNTHRNMPATYVMPVQIAIAAR